MMLFNLHAPKISLIYTGILGVMYVALSFNVIRYRRLKKVGIGHSTDPECELFRAVRIHGNFSEYVPFLLLLLVLDEVTGRKAYMVHILGSMIVLGRAAHFVGITQSHKVTLPRFGGAAITFLTIIILSILLLIKGVA